MTRRSALSLATIFASFAFLVLIAAPAFAYAPRTYEFQFKGPDQTGFFENISIAALTNRVWLNDNPAGLIYQFNAEGEKLAPEINERSPRVYSIAADHENHDLYEGDNFFDIIGIYSSTGAPVSSFGTAGGGISIAVDNSVPPTAGRIYIAHGVELEAARELSNLSAKTVKRSPSETAQNTSKATRFPARPPVTSLTPPMLRSDQAEKFTLSIRAKSMSSNQAANLFVNSSPAAVGCQMNSIQAELPLIPRLAIF